jgi:hypothetical protein
MRSRATFLAALVAGAACAPIAADAKKAHPGPCRQGQVVSLVDRPGTGSAPTTSGSPCTVPPHHVVIEAGYRNEVDATKGAGSNLSTYPFAVIRIGLDKHDEVLFQAPTTSIRSGTALPNFAPQLGSQDTGFGIKHAIHSRWWYQDAVQVFVTTPTGTPGFTAQAPTYSFSYVGSFSPPGRVTLTGTMAIVNAPGPAPFGLTRRFASYQPALTAGYALSNSTSLLLNDNLAFPTTPDGGSGNAFLVALQRALSPGIVIDTEYESNFLPDTNFREHAVGFGGAFML